MRFKCNSCNSRITRKLLPTSIKSSNIFFQIFSLKLGVGTRKLADSCAANLRFPLAGASSCAVVPPWVQPPARTCPSRAPWILRCRRTAASMTARDPHSSPTSPQRGAGLGGGKLVSARVILLNDSVHNFQIPVSSRVLFQEHTTSLSTRHSTGHVITAQYSTEYTRRNTEKR